MLESYHDVHFVSFQSIYFDDVKSGNATSTEKVYRTLTFSAFLKYVSRLVKKVQLFDSNVM